MNLESTFTDMDETHKFRRMLNWAAGIVDEFAETNLEGKFRRKGTNFCRACRMIFVYAPFILFLHVLMATWAATVLIALPIHLWGLGGYFSFAGGIAVLATIIFAVKLLTPRVRAAKFEWSYKRAANRRGRFQARSNEESPKHKGEPAKKEPGVVSIFFQWGAGSRHLGH